MYYTQQVSVFMENKPGKISEITTVLHNADIDIRAFCISDTAEFGILRLIVSNPRQAAELLRASGLTAQLSCVIVVSIPDKIGSLSEMVGCLSESGVNIQYMYSFMSEKRSQGHVALHCDDPGRAAEVLQSSGFSVECTEV